MGRQRILDPTAPLDGDLLRSLSKDDLQLARLEMQWDRRDTGHLWIKFAVKMQCLFRGRRARALSTKRSKARAKRRVAICHIEKAKKAKGNEALSFLEVARGADPSCDEVIFLQCQTYYEDLADSTKARTVLDQTRNKNDPRYLILAGRCDLSLRYYDRAIDELSALIEDYEAPNLTDDSTTVTNDKENDCIDPRQFQVGSHDIFASAHFLRGHASAAAGKWIDAQHDFYIYLQKVPQVERKRSSARTGATQDEISSWKLRAEALQAYGLAAAANDDYNLAISALTESSILFPTATSLALLARVHCCERQWSLAEARYRDALTIDPQSKQASIGLEQATIQHEPIPLLSTL